MKNALILVDLQVDFLPGGALPVTRGEEVIPLANALQPYFDLIVATQDWHPADHRSFASQHPTRNVGDVVELDGVAQVLWPDHCVQGTAGARFAPGLQIDSIAHVFPKGIDPHIDSYSGFFDNGHRRSTGLGEYLQQRQVNEVYVLGLATDYCVRATVLDALQLGLRTHVIADACRGVELRAGDSELALADMERAGASRVRSAQWLQEESRRANSGSGMRSLAQGKFLQLVESRNWEFVRRSSATGVVVIVAVTDRGELVLVEQYREPLGRRAIELPAGLVGDVAGSETEELEVAVRRELREETGYAATRVECLGCLSTSAGLTSEAVHVFLATGLVPTHDPLGDGDEEIVVHRVLWPDVPHWLSRRGQQGYSIALSLTGSLWLAEHSPLSPLRQFLAARLTF